MKPEAPAGPQTAALAAGYGAFMVSGLEFALPLAAVREVVPMVTPCVLPGKAFGLVGAVELRGVLLPVLDLAVLFEQPVRPGGCVVVMLHQGHLLGLRVDAVGGLFMVRPGSLVALEGSDALSGVLAASLRRDDSGALLSLLSPAGLCSLPGLPLLADPEPQREQRGSPSTPVALDKHAAQVLLLSAAGLPLAIPATAVHATVANPSIEPSPLAHGHCLGLTRFAGELIPVVDLPALLQLGSLGARPDLQAFVLRVDAGLVCLLVGKVIDVVLTRHDEAITVASSALPQARLFAGMLPADALPAELRARAPTGDGDYLMLDAAGLRALPYLNMVAAASRGGRPFEAEPGEAPAGAAAGNALAGRSLLVFELMGRMASPAEQVCEILPWRSEALRLAGQAPLLALLVNRGRSVPVLDLAALLGTPPPALGRDACVLLVEAAGAVVGFVVPRLHAIERSDWESSQPGHGLGPTADAIGRRLPERQVVRIGQGSEARLLRVIDLHALALAWLMPGAASVPAAGPPPPTVNGSAGVAEAASRANPGRPADTVLQD